MIPRTNYADEFHKAHSWHILKCALRHIDAAGLNAIIAHMALKFRSKIMTGTGTDLAIAMVVLVTYFFIFSNFGVFNGYQIFGLIIIGVTYLANGIYGYSYCSQDQSNLLSSTYILVQILLVSLIVLLTKGLPLSALLYMPIVVHITVLLSAKWILILNAIMAAVYAFCLYFTAGRGLLLNYLPLMVGGQFLIVNFVQMILNEERSRIEIEGLIKDLEATNEQLRSYASQIEDLTLSRERNRMAREIHDGLGHYLTTIGMQIKAAQAIMRRNPDEAAELLRTAETLSTDALKDVRQSVSALRDVSSSEEPLISRIERLLKPFENTGYRTMVQITGEDAVLSPEVEVLLFRSLQEGLSNIGKHSNAKNIVVGLTYHTEGKVSLDISDDGTGEKKIDGGYGIQGIRERVEHLNGTLEISTDKNKGFKLRVTVPEK